MAGLSADQLLGPTEEYSHDAHRGVITRVVRHPDRVDGHRSEVPCPEEGGTPEDLGASFDRAWLRSEHRPPGPLAPVAEVRVVDLFCGLGGMSIGIQEACRALGLGVRHTWVADVDASARDVFKGVFPGVSVDDRPVESRLNGRLGRSLTRDEEELREEVGNLDLLMGGPPCQGHSNLNNHTRRKDPKNALYLRMARAAEVLKPAHIIIENVPGVRHDHGSVMQLTLDHLRKLGYQASAGLIRAESLGVPQTRHRMFLVATSTPTRESLDLHELLDRHQVPERSALWAVDDLKVDESSSFDSPSRPHPRTRQRIEWLFAEPGRYNLPDRLRPDCHRLKEHSYTAVYGRIFPDRPAPTITTGFLVMGQGRFVHPTRPRTLTPHEGARIQFLPDWVEFPEGLRRKDFASLIGNAVPPKLTYVLGLELLGLDVSSRLEDGDDPAATFSDVSGSY